MKNPDINLDKAFQALQNELQEWFVAVILNLPNFILAIIIFIIFIFVAKYTKKGFTKIYTKISSTKTVTKLIGNLIAISIVIFGLIIALGILQLDKTVSSILTGAGIIGLAIGFAFQDIIVNIFSGIVIAFNEPIKEGDLIETNDVIGTVDHIKLRAVFIDNLKGQLVIIPCRDIIQKRLINYTKHGFRRIDVPVGISYGEDLEKVKKVTVNAVRNVNNLVKDKGIDFYYEGFGDSSINFIVRFWIPIVDQVSYFTTKSDAIMKIKKAYNENDITIPFPIRTLDFGIKGGEKLNAMLSEKYRSDKD